MGYLGLGLVMLGIWDHCIRKERLSSTDAQTTAVITSIYDNPGTTGLRNYRVELSLDVDNQNHVFSERIPVLAEGQLLSETIYPYLNDIPMIVGMDVYVKYHPEKPKVAQIIRDSFPEATLELAQIVLQDWLEGYHENPEGIVKFAYETKGLKGLQTLFWVSRQESVSLTSEVEQSWASLQEHFAKAEN